MNDMYKKATRLKLRFKSNKGELSVEDLWDLSLQSLDRIAKSVNKQIREEDEESFISSKSTVSTGLHLQLDILKDIISVKLAERDAAKERSEIEARATLIKNIMAEKAVENLKNQTLEELEAQLKELQGS